MQPAYASSRDFPWIERLQEAAGVDDSLTVEDKLTADVQQLAASIKVRQSSAGDTLLLNVLQSSVQDSTFLQFVSMLSICPINQHSAGMQHR